MPGASTGIMTILQVRLSDVSDFIKDTILSSSYLIKALYSRQCIDWGCRQRRTPAAAHYSLAETVTTEVTKFL
eukprot:g43655.t1